MFQPKVSIITVVYNAEKALPHTFASVFAQTYPNIEYIVVDGKSKDGTVELIRANESRIAKWVSEPDKGIYDAMNKGLQMATGDYVWFMNGGDLIFDADTTTRLFASGENCDVYYGDAMMMTENFEDIGLRRHKKLPQNLTWRGMKYGMVVCHQSLVVKRSLAPLYDLNHRYVADIDWTIRILKQAKTVKNTGLILSKFQAGGFSTQHLRASLKDRYAVLQKYFGFLPNLFNHALIYAGALANRITGGN